MANDDIGDDVRAAQAEQSAIRRRYLAEHPSYRRAVEQPWTMESAVSNSGALSHGGGARPAIPAIAAGQRATAYLVAQLDQARLRAVDELGQPDADPAVVLGVLLMRLGVLAETQRRILDPAAMAAAQRAVAAGEHG